MAKYYTDQEILNKIRYIGDSKDSYEWVSELVEERFMQKNQRNEHLSRRLDEAAKIIGHNTISECMQYE